MSKDPNFVSHVDHFSSAPAASEVNSEYFEGDKKSNGHVKWIAVSCAAMLAAGGGAYFYLNSSPEVAASAPVEKAAPQAAE